MSAPNRLKLYYLYLRCKCEQHRGGSPARGRNRGAAGLTPLFSCLASMNAGQRLPLLSYWTGVHLARVVE